MLWIRIKRVLTLLLNCTPLAFVGMFCWVTIFPLARWRSRQNLPAILQKIGFAVSSEAASGKRKGYQVQIEADNAVVMVEFNRPKSVEINDDKPYHEPREDLREFSAGNTVFNAIFRTRRAHRADLDLFTADARIASEPVSFYTRWLWRIQEFRIDDDGLKCRLNWGNPFSAYIPVRHLEKLLDELCDLAKIIETELTDK